MDRVLETRIRRCEERPSRLSRFEIRVYISQTYKRSALLPGERESDWLQQVCVLPAAPMFINSCVAAGARVPCSVNKSSQAHVVHRPSLAMFESGCSIRLLKARRLNYESMTTCPSGFIWMRRCATSFSTTQVPNSDAIPSAVNNICCSGACAHTGKDSAAACRIYQAR